MTEIEKTLPDYYKKSRYMSAVCEASDAEFDRLYGKADNFENNISTDTADENGIIAFERDFNIKTTKDTMEIRVSRIKAKKRGTQTTSEINLTNSLRLFDSTASIEQNVSDYSFDVMLHNPNVLGEVMDMVEDLKPAHLAVSHIVRMMAQSDIYAGAKVVGIKRTLPKVEAAEIPRESEILSGVAIGAKVAGIKRTLPKVDAMQYNTYEDIKQYSNDEIKNKTYLELLYKQEEK